MIVLVDVDGTLAIRDGRDPFEWELSYSDRPNQPVVEVVRGLASLGHEFVFISGRHESLREATEKWISEHINIPGPLLMRRDSDMRSDEIVKEELVRAHFADMRSILLVLDDRSRVVRMWRESFGLTCLQVASGDF